MAGVVAALHPAVECTGEWRAGVTWRSHERDCGVETYPEVERRRGAVALRFFPLSAIVVGSWCSTKKANCGGLRGGATTDLMGQVWNALAARRSAPRPAGDRFGGCRGKGSDKSAGAVSEGAQKFCGSLACDVQAPGGGRLDGHRVSTSHALEASFTWCARSERGLRPGPVNPHRDRADLYGMSPLHGRWWPVRCPNRRAKAKGAPAPAVRPGRVGRTARSHRIQRAQVRR